MVILQPCIPNNDIPTQIRPILHRTKHRHNGCAHACRPQQRSCLNAEEVFRFQDATTIKTHNARSMCCNSNLTVEPEIISRAHDFQNKSPPGVQSRCSPEAASLPHSAAPPRAASECRSSNTSGPIPQTALQKIASSTADRALTSPLYCVQQAAVMSDRASSEAARVHAETSVQDVARCGFPEWITLTAMRGPSRRALV